MPFDLDPDRMADVCEGLSPEDGLAPLVEAVGRAAGLGLVHVLTRDGWYRVGGVVDAEGNRIADALREWAEEAGGGDVLDLTADYADAGYRATRILGKTHYLVAPTGDDPLDFVQVEVEEVREVADRMLFDPDDLPDDMEDLIDPMDPVRIDPVPVSEPRFRLRRLAHFADCAWDPESGWCGDKRFHRFIEEWQSSSAAAAVRFCDFWVLTLLPFTDRFGEERHGVKPRPVGKEDIPRIDAEEVERGSALGRTIHDFDRRVGYPMAWYFLMLTNHGVSHEIAQAIHADLMGAYAYLPARDLRILKGWIRDPYSL